MREFKSSKDLEQAVKAAAQKTGRQTEKVQEEYWRSKLLDRLFYSDDPRYVLKGGTSILARIPDARRTRDLDIYAMHSDEAVALDEIKRLARRDLDDFCHFELVERRRTQQEASYRRGYELKFQLYVGAKKVASLIRMDLILGCSPTADIEMRYPKNLEGFPRANIKYPLYPLVDHIADKVCAIMETHGGSTESSRTKDLVDLCLIATNETLSLKPLAIAIASETRLRTLDSLREFAIPNHWQKYPKPYKATASDSGLDMKYRELSEASNLAKAFLDPAFKAPKEDKEWNPRALKWE